MCKVDERQEVRRPIKRGNARPLQVYCNGYDLLLLVHNPQRRGRRLDLFGGVVPAWPAVGSRLAVETRNGPWARRLLRTQLQAE